jgi:hypothetical protein
MRRLPITGVVVLALGLAACAERAQTIASGPEKKADTPAWQAGSTPFTAAGYTPGDKANWEKQLRARAQAQNDYAAPK